HRPTSVMKEYKETWQPDIFFFEETGWTLTEPETGEHLRCVHISALPGRLTSHQSGHVCIGWMLEGQVSQSLEWDENLVRLSSHDRHASVHEHDKTQGGTNAIPMNVDTTTTKEEMNEDTLHPKEDAHLLPGVPLFVPRAAVLSAFQA